MKKITQKLMVVALVFSTLAFTLSSEWQLFENNDLQAFFPKLPKKQVQSINTAIGKLEMNIYMHEAQSEDQDDNLVYGLITTEYPDSIINSETIEDLESFFRNSIDGAVSNVKGKLLKETEIKINGYPGREIKVDFKDGMAIIRMRLYLVKNKMIMQQTITLTDKDNNKSIERYMNSLKLK
jgi:hypothetical protein